MAERSENWAVSKLLGAEKEANQTIKAAEQDRAKKLNLAREAALTQVNDFKQEEEQRYQEAISTKFGQTEDDGKTEEQTKKDIEVIKSEYDQHRKEVIKQLYQQILNVKIEISDTVRDTIRAQNKKN